MNNTNILISESNGFSPKALDLLRSVAHVALADLDRDGLKSALEDTDILWVRLRNQIDDGILEHAPRLKLVASATTGLTHIDKAALAERGITLVSLAGEGNLLRDVRATAEHALGLMLALIRHIPQAHKHVTEGGWDRDAFLGSELFGKTVGVIGYGRLGRLVAGYLLTFGCEVIAADPAALPGTLDPGVTLVSLHQLLRRADIVTVHVNLCEANHGFLGEPHFECMKLGSYFINTSRGELLDEAALLHALETNSIAGAALDVLCHETSLGMGTSQLVRYAAAHDNLLITPHIGGCTVESMEKTEYLLAQKLHHYLTSRLSGPFLAKRNGAAALPLQA
jgi:D-3-phosphoglycerate dehydrogenase / 2-oxoglutarate reductase